MTRTLAVGFGISLMFCACVTEVPRTELTEDDEEPMHEPRANLPVTGDTQAQPNHGYISNEDNDVVLTLPAALGSDRTWLMWRVPASVSRVSPVPSTLMT